MRGHLGTDDEEMRRDAILAGGSSSFSGDAHWCEEDRNNRVPIKWRINRGRLCQLACVERDAIHRILQCVGMLASVLKNKHAVDPVGPTGI